MALLYPPQIEGTLPAFTGKQIKIPFYMNKTVGWPEVHGFSLLVKNIMNNSVIGGCISTDWSEDKCEVYFDISDQISRGIARGNHYKFQLAYVDSTGAAGYYSTVGIAKYTSQPEVSIQGLSKNEINLYSNSYVGVYTQYNDVSEKIYSYEFVIYDKEENVVFTSGEKLHNHENNTVVNETTDEYNFYTVLPNEDEVYYLCYKGTTINNLEFSSPKYRIMQQSSIDATIQAELIGTMNYENGYIELQVVGKSDENGVEQLGSGNYVISRSSSEDNYTTWSEISKFALYDTTPSKYVWRDLSVQHGVVYKYSLQQYNQRYQVYSNRILSNEIEAYFEHSFLYDGERQLKIKFNPKVSSFKETLLDQKQNTIGNKFPFFFRNGIVGYKEFPIAGLISYLSDDEGLFLFDAELGIETLPECREETETNVVYAFEKTRSTQLTDHNIKFERIFKNKVLEFLNSEKPKLFRSPTEGSYLVRLMSSTLSPNDQLGRMLHSFSTQATEIDECSLSKLVEYGIAHFEEPDTKTMRWSTIDIANQDNYKEVEVCSAELIAEPRFISETETMEDGAKRNCWELQLDYLSMISPLSQGSRINIQGTFKEENGELQNVFLEDYVISRIVSDSDGKKNFYVYTKAKNDDEKKAEAEQFISLDKCHWIYISVLEGLPEFALYDSIYSIRAYDFIPGSSFEVMQKNKDGEIERFPIVIGPTGEYSADFLDQPISGFAYSIEKNKSGFITYKRLEDSFQNLFDNYKKIYIRDIGLQQFIGAHTEDGIGAELMDIKHELIKYYFVNLKKRPVIDLYFDDNTKTFCWDGFNFLRPLTSEELLDLDDLAVYRINYADGHCEYHDGREELSADSDRIEYSTITIIEGVEIDVNDVQNIIYTDLNGNTKIQPSSGVYVEISAQYREIEYSFETTSKYPKVQKAKKLYETAHNDLISFIYDVKFYDEGYYDNRLKSLREREEKAYENFIYTLKSVLLAEGVLEL